jgi:hypothetical protein
MATLALAAGRPPAEVAVRIPFNFMVGRHMFPAGSYRIRAMGANGVRIQAVRGLTAVMVATEQPVQITPRPLRLIFDQESHPARLLGVFGDRETSPPLAVNPSRPLTVVTTNPGAVLASDGGAHRY